MADEEIKEATEAETPKEEVAFYIGASRVLSTDQDTETGMVKYVLEGSEMVWECTLDQYKSMADTQPYPDGEVRIRKFTAMVKAVMQIFLENNIQMGDKDFVIQRIDETIVQNYQIAVAKALGRRHTSFVTFKQLDEILKKDTTGEQK